MLTFFLLFPQILNVSMYIKVLDFDEEIDGGGKNYATFVYFSFTQIHCLLCLQYQRSV